MLTPQEVASHAFARATLGGYNMAMVDEFLDLLTEDYTALYNENAILKGKLKVLSDTIEEYRATDNAMRKTLLAAQQMADAMVAEAEEKKSSLVKDAEANAAARVAELKDAIAAEEYRLKLAQEATAAYVQKLAALHDEEMVFLSRLGEVVPPRTADITADIQASMSAIIGKEEEPAPAPAAGEEETAVFTPVVVEEEPAAEVEEEIYEEELDPDVTQRFENLQFGKDYEIK